MSHAHCYYIRAPIQRHLRLLMQHESSMRVCGPIVILDLDNGSRKTDMETHLVNISKKADLPYHQVQEHLHFG